MADGGVFFELALQPNLSFEDSNTGAVKSKGRLDALELDEALALTRIALDAQFLGRALFERCPKNGTPAFENSALLAAADERELRALLNSAPKRLPKSARL